MAIFHFSVKICSRGSGRSAIATCAYIHADRIRSGYDGKTYDFTMKQGVVHEGIMLPPGIENIERYRDRKVLWDSVELVEKGKRAQLARTIEASLPRELPRDGQIKLAEEYLKPFAEKGMCVDYAVHDRGDGNPHLHAMLTIRPLNPDGSWGAKSRKIYALDENGDKIYDKEKKQYRCHVDRTTDWDRRDNVELWRQQWAELTNRTLKEAGIDAGVDHRSYERQGIDRIPHLSLSKEALSLERRGVNTDVSELNDLIDETAGIVGSIDHAMMGIIRSMSNPDQEKRKRRR